MNARADQVATEIQRELAELLRTEVRDPRLGYVTITRVDVTQDLSVARIYISELPQAGSSAGQSMQAIDRAKGFLRRELGKRLRIRHTPELRFEEDHSIEEGIRMTQLLDGLAGEQSDPDSDEDGGEELNDEQR